MVAQTVMGSPSISRQGSIYSLTLDEVQNQLGNLGKPLGSMNLDELLRTVWAGEPAENGAGSQAGSQPVQVVSGSGLTKQTVEEVWREIQQGKRNHERQNTLGEMTLEDFLAQAGVAVEAAAGGAGGGAAAAQWAQYQMVPHQQGVGAVGVFLPGQQGVDAAYVDSSVSPSALMGQLSDSLGSGRKRVASGGVVKTVERRQKRMIKNRESAARSRARKQAYTHELENKVSRLEEENERLRRMKEVEKALPCVPPPEPKYQLRRTSSASF